MGRGERSRAKKKVVSAHTKKTLLGFRDFGSLLSLPSPLKDREIEVRLKKEEEEEEEEKEEEEEEEEEEE